MEDIDLDDFVASVLCLDEPQDNSRFLKVPQLVATSSFQFPLLMKTELDKKQPRLRAPIAENAKLIKNS